MKNSRERRHSKALTGVDNVEKTPVIWSRYNNQIDGGFFNLSGTNISQLERMAQTGELLTDGKRPWLRKKKGSLRIAEVFQMLDEAKRSKRMVACGSWLEFVECHDHADQKRLRRANFCRERMCPMCGWRRSLRWAFETTKVLHEAQQRDPKRRWVMLTLTQKNVTSEELAEEIRHVLHAFGKLRKRKDLRAVAGWLRTLEVTRNAENGTWHPHLHVLLWVKPEYFTRAYVKQDRWRELWAEVAGLNYSPMVEVHAVKARKNDRANDEGLAAAAQEVSKYTVKDSDVIDDHGSDEEIAERVEVLASALAHKRLIEWGGGLKTIARELSAELDEVDEEAMIHTSDEDHGKECPVCQLKMVAHIFQWRASAQNYIG